MKYSVAFGVLFAAGALTVGTAQAADLYTPTPDPVIEYASPGFDWDGFYAGVGGAGSIYNNATNAGQIEVELGANFTASEWLFGVEAFGGYEWVNNGSNGWLLGAEARAGYLVAPEVLLYLSGGAVYYANGAITFGTAGAGAEFAVTDSMTIDVEYKFKWNNAVNGHEIGASALWHF